MNQKKNKSVFFADLIIGVIFLLFFISLGLYLAVHFKSIYYFDINYLKIPETSGLSKEIIIENYNALIAYCSPFFTGELKFPSLLQSPTGTSHFQEVKVIFNFFFYVGILCFFLLVFLVLYKMKKKDTRFLLVSSVTSIVLPLLVLLGCAINFNQAFVFFHKLFFRNDDWLFDPSKDQVITILPETFFLHSALFIAGVVMAGSILLLILWLFFRKTNLLKKESS